MIPVPIEVESLVTHSLTELHLQESVLRGRKVTLSGFVVYGSDGWHKICEFAGAGAERSQERIVLTGELCSGYRGKLAKQRAVVSGVVRSGEASGIVVRGKTMIYGSGKLYQAGLSQATLLWVSP